MDFETYSKILQKRRERKPSFFFGLLIFIAGFFLMLLSLNIYNPSLVPNELRVINLNKKINILILGCDEINPGGGEVDSRFLWRGRSDTIVLVNCNPFKNTINILNIPRDTRIKIPQHGAEKLNYLNSVLGPVLTKKHLEKLLKIKIDYYVIVNVNGLSKIIDEIGGIVADVPQRMQYDDYSAKLHINLHPGRQRLNGTQAVGFVRYRHDSLGDIGRIQRQQAFMRAVFNKLLDPVTFTKLPEIISIYKKTILTNLKPNDIIKIANFVRNVPASKQNIVILPGEFGYQKGISYWIPNVREIDIIIKKFFYDDRRFLKYARINPSNIKISIFNGSKSDNHLAGKVASILREYGYTILLLQDYESPVKKSRIYAQKANPEIALQIKYDLGNMGDLIIGNLGPPDADVTILAGDDLINLKVKEKH